MNWFDSSARFHFFKCEKWWDNWIWMWKAIGWEHAYETEDL